MSRLPRNKRAQPGHEIARVEEDVLARHRVEHFAGRVLDVRGRPIPEGTVTSGRCRVYTRAGGTFQAVYLGRSPDGYRFARLPDRVLLVYPECPAFRFYAEPGDLRAKPDPLDRWRAPFRSGT